ncbi:CoA-binding protein [Massilia sp. H-1]|nr:CoA-binding protein [Massilia sp. H-1]
MGASERAASVGATVLRNVLGGGFGGRIYPVNPKYDTLAGLLAYPDVRSLPEAPSLAIICTPAATVLSHRAPAGQNAVRARPSSSRRV